MPIYQILNFIMNCRGLTVAEVARLCDLPDSTVRGIITRRQKSIALEVAFKLSAGLDVPLEYLNGQVDLERIDEKKAPTNKKVDADEHTQEYIMLWNNATPEGKQAALVLLRGFQSPQQSSVGTGT